MLPSELLVAKTFKGAVRPCYLAPTPPLLNLAQSIIEVYREHLGKKRSQVRSHLRLLEYGPHNFRLVRGLSAVLDRFSEFATDSPVDPQTIRKTLFALSKGFAPSPAERQEVILEASERLKVPPDWIERYMWSDLEGEQILKSFTPPTPEELLAHYNLSLTQTLLFKSKFVEFSVEGNWKRIFRSIKRLGLMYSISGSPGTYNVLVEGPISIIKMTERYGTSLAKLLPEILASKNWRIRAQIIGRGNRLLNFELKSSEGVHFPEPPEPEVYDSSLEESFAQRFSSLGSRWRLLREPDPIPVPGGAMIPDFAFELQGRRVYLEIVGFWTPEYIRKKISKIQAARDRNVNLIVAADVDLGVSGEIPGDVITFRGEVPLKPILDRLEKEERVMVASELSRLGRLPLAVEGPLVHVGDLASNLGVSREALLKRLSESPPEGYVLVGEDLIRKDRLQRLAPMVTCGSPLEELVRRLKGEGISDPIALIHHLGFTVKWRGLNSAEVAKSQNSK
jgi:predicted nuclease of restriction endonuclease-like RecB superfamily